MTLSFPAFTIKVFLSVFVIYYLQGLLYPSGSLISQGCLLIFLLLSLFYTIKVMSNKRIGSFVVCLFVFVLLEICYAFFSKNYHVGGDVVTNMSRLKLILMSLLAFFPSYYWASRGEMPLNYMKSFFLICFVVMAFRFFNMETMMQVALDREEITNNSAYFFVHLMPSIILFSQRRMLPILLLAFSLLFVIIGAKRGAFIIAVVVLLIYVWYRFRLCRSQKGRVRLLLLVAMCVGVISYSSLGVFWKESHIFERLLELEGGGVSNRDVLYMGIWNYWYNCDSIIHYFFGFGFNSSVDIVGNLAHNDWLELLSSSGLLGVGIYMLVFYTLFKTCQDRQLNIHEQAICIMVFVVWFCLTIFSMGYTDMVFEMILLGYVLGIARMRKIIGYKAELIKRRI